MERRPRTEGGLGNAASSLLRSCASAPNGLTQTARLVGRSWNFRAKQRRKFSIPGGDDDTNSAATTWKPGTKALNAGRRFDITQEDNAQSFDELFQREIVKMPARMELASQADELISIISKAQVSQRHHTLRAIKATNTDEAPSAEDAVKAEVIFKYRCLVGRDVDFVQMLPGYANNALNAKMLALGQRYHANDYAACLAEFEQCWDMNAEAINRPTLLYDRAILLGHVGDFKRAMAELNEAIKVDNEDPRYFKLRSILWRLQEKYIEAAKDSSRAHAIHLSKSKHRQHSTMLKKVAKAVSVSGHTALNAFDEACETPIQERTSRQIQVLVEQSYRIPFLARLDVDLLHLLWKNLTYAAWPSDTRVVLPSSTVSLYVVLEGSVAVQTELRGAIEAQRTLEAGNIFCEGSISANLWAATSLVALTASKVLTLESVLYKHTLRNIMLEGASTRAHFFRDSGIFASWSDDQLNTLGILSEQLEYAARETIVTEGAPALHLYFVRSGYCGAIRMLQQHPIQVGSVSSGDVFGEAAVLDPIGGIFPFTITTVTVCKIIRIQKSFLNRRLPFEVLRLGPIDAAILAKIEKLSVRCPADKVLAQMIRDNCSWTLKREKVLHRLIQENAKSTGKHLLLPSVHPR
ncbi:hypothetical protein, variant [Saprolegnia diclina VS20]|uniref:Cyclic nucleotide-binding domain-containing protein n=1 Tax=Saprolegnia diclina (strain VS20) TaxID=1156394 RepID=T0S6K8_SAPDV|nr:hypothetical protein, variant [Saprolegnia diclina VS20]EQC40798.1 hypothetical protein, variant [Saprolegnia diclina VS20]|eukprot:XP_008605642.1 hypothetical protein, variant [Saprolegnia diclina VS20]